MMTDRRSWLLMSRRRIVIVTIALLALLDLGRSIFARVGYASPLSIWQPDPKVYADLTWPPEADLPANTLPPVKNRIPAPLHYGVVETIVSKLTRPLPAVPTIKLTYADGQFGQIEDGAPREWPQTWLIRAQWLVLVVGLILFVVAAPADRRWPRTRKGWLKLAAGLVGFALLGLLGSALYNLPLLRIIPPAQIISGATAGLPTPDTARIGSPERAAMVARGRYIYSVASCALCHGANGSGGPKVSWKPMGTLWVRNITPDSEAGLGRWSDAEISRAIRSGVSRDGYQLHWQE